MTGILNLLAGAVSSVIKDTYFNLTTLLLPGDGTNGAQNNTFLDSSTNNFTITRNGNTTQGTFSPFSQTGWGNYFAGGANQWIQAPYNTAFDFGTGDFSVECFAYVTDAGRSYDASKFGTFVSGGAAVSLTNIWNFYFKIVSGVISEIYFSVNGTNQLSITSQSISLNAWHHFVVCRTGSTLSIFVDGTRIGTVTYSSSVNTNSSGRIVISQDTYQDQFQNWLIGYMSNVRIIKGTQPYNAASSTITQPTSPLTNITNTSLLTCQSNRFVDNSTANSGSGFTITVTGTPSVQAFSPFAPTAAYSAATVGGSGYFDGTGDYLSIADNTAMELGSSNFCIEFWINTTTSSQYDCVIGREAVTPGTGMWSLQLNSGSAGSGDIAFWSWDFNSFASPMLITSGVSLRDAAWHHVAVVRNGSSWVIYVDGVSRATQTSSITIGNISLDYWIGNNPANTTRDFPGYLSSFRYVVGSAVYTAAFTPPTAPLTAITNTSLLLNFTNAGITDATAKNDLETVGNAQISTTQSKFGGSSMYFDGTGDWLSTRMTENLVLRSDFTLEAWVYPTTITGSSRTILFLENGANSATFYISSSGILNLDIAGVANYTLGSTAVTTNSWQYIAFVRSGSTLTGYINGSSVGTATVTASIGSTGSCLVGANSGSGGAPFFGYMDDLRLTKGYARTITTPTAAFPTQ